MSLAVLACAALLGQKPAPLSPALKKQIVEGIGNVLREIAFVPGVDFTTWPKVAQRHKKALDAARTPDAFAAEVGAALGEYGVSHLALVRPGKGPGTTVRSFGFYSTVYNDQNVVLRVYAGTQAERAGLRRGMILSTFSFPDFPNTDRIEVGHFDNAHVLRTATIGKETFVPRETPDLVWVDKDTCALVVPSFHDGYDKQMVEQCVRNAARFSNLLIDLRGNPGGSPDNATHFLGAFLPPGTRVGAAVSKELLRDYAKAKGKGPIDRAALVRWAPKAHTDTVPSVKATYKGHIAALIDEGTGSAAECVALALRDVAGTPIFGRRSAGAVLYANGCPLPGGYMLYFPWRDYWTARGERIEGHPIVPDVEVADDSEEAGLLPYPLRRKATEWLHEKYPAQDPTPVGG